MGRERRASGNYHVTRWTALSNLPVHFRIAEGEQERRDVAGLARSRNGLHTHSANGGQVQQDRRGVPEHDAAQPDGHRRCGCPSPASKQQLHAARFCSGAGILRRQPAAGQSTDVPHQHQPPSIEFGDGFRWDVPDKLVQCLAPAAHTFLSIYRWFCFMFFSGFVALVSFSLI